MENVRPISDFNLNVIFPDAEQVEFETLEGKKIDIAAVKPMTGEFGAYFIFLFQFDGEDKQYSTSTGSKAVVDKLQRLSDLNAYPVSATVAKVKDYFDLQ